MSQALITVFIGAGTSALTAILAVLVRMSRQIARMVQYFDGESPVSEALGGTVPSRLQLLEEQVRAMRSRRSTDG